MEAAELLEKRRHNTGQADAEQADLILRLDVHDLSLIGWGKVLRSDFT